jgi:hypothetical protein
MPAASHEYQKQGSRKRAETPDPLPTHSGPRWTVVKLAEIMCVSLPLPPICRSSVMRFKSSIERPRCLMPSMNTGWRCSYIPARSICFSSCCNRHLCIWRNRTISPVGLPSPGAGERERALTPVGNGTCEVMVSKCRFVEGTIGPNRHPAAPRPARARRNDPANTQRPRLRKPSATPTEVAYSGPYGANSSALSLGMGGLAGSPRPRSHGDQVRICARCANTKTIAAGVRFPWWGLLWRS